MADDQDRTEAGPRLAVRPATSADHPWLFDLHERAHRELVERAYGPWEDEQQRGFFTVLVDQHDVFVLSHADEQVGAAYLGERDGDLWLELLEVHPAHQRRGFGTEALRWVVRRATDQDRGTVLQVHRVNEDARRLYLTRGFTPVGETPTHHLLRTPAGGAAQAAKPSDR